MFTPVPSPPRGDASVHTQRTSKQNRKPTWPKAFKSLSLSLSDLDLWPSDSQSRSFHTLACGPLASIGIKINSSVFKLLCSKVWYRYNYRYSIVGFNITFWRRSSQPATWLVQKASLPYTKLNLTNLMPGSGGHKCHLARKWIRPILQFPGLHGGHTSGNNEWMSARMNRWTG